MVLNFHSKQSTLRIALCFDCDIAGIFDGEAENAQSINTGGDFDPMHKQLVRIAKSIFPNDSEIQALK